MARTIAELPKGTQITDYIRRSVKRRMSNFPLRLRAACLNVHNEISGYIKILK